MLGSELDNLFKSYILQLREIGGVVNLAIVMSAAIGIVKTRDANLLKYICGHI